MSEQKKLLLIDDNEDVLTTLTDRLESEGYLVLQASSGQMGIDMAQQEHPDLIILDIMMPHMSGHQVWSYFQHDKELKKIPFLILTAKRRVEDTFWGKNLPAEDFISKPFEVRELLSRIREKVNPDAS